MNIVYLNGEFLPIDQAKVSVLDRGFLFGDGIYEVIPVYAGQPFRLAEHLQRLANSLKHIRLANPYTFAEWENLFKTLLEKNPSAKDQSIYLQITRGAAAVRDHSFPQEVKPTIFIMCNAMKAATAVEPCQAKGIKAITVEDIRWQRCDIKAITLLANILLRQQAVEAQADEAILIRNGQVIEGAASNIFIVSQQVIYTPPKGPLLLGGITRDLVIELALYHQLPLQERAISLFELQQADEIWLTSSTKEILPVVELDQKPVGKGKVGTIWAKMAEHYQVYKNSLNKA